MRWRWLVGAAGGLLLVGAAVVAVLTVGVGAGLATSSRSCGSPFDVIAGRADWQQWWAQDRQDPGAGAGGRLLRVRDCPDAVNRRTALAGGLFGGGVVALVGSQAARRRRSAAGAVRSAPARRLRTWAVAAMVTGSALTVAGLAALIVLLANPHRLLFLYVDRAEAALIGLLLLLPAPVLIFVGRGADLLARHLEGRNERDAPL